MLVLYRLIIDYGGGLVEISVGGIGEREIVITCTVEFIADTEAAVRHSEVEINSFTIIILLPHKTKSQLLHFPLKYKSHDVAVFWRMGCHTSEKYQKLIHTEGFRSAPDKYGRRT